MDDYLANRLSDADRISFEQKLEADPTLKSEFASQQSFVEGIKKARIAELKNIMNNTPIPPAVGSGSVATIKVATFIVALGIIGFGIYWFATEDKLNSTEIAEDVRTIEPTLTESEMEDTEKVEPESTETEVEVVAPKEENKISTKPKATPKVKQPKLDVYDPTKEVTEDQTAPDADPIIPGVKKVSSLIVETDNTQRKYTFHYQFQDGKLILMGPFDSTLYEIMEFFTDDKRTIFLYYTGNYYLLDETKEKPTPLNSITDSKLLKKLELYRSN